MLMIWTTRSNSRRSTWCTRLERKRAAILLCLVASNKPAIQAISSVVPAIKCFFPEGRTMVNVACGGCVMIAMIYLLLFCFYSQPPLVEISTSVISTVCASQQLYRHSFHKSLLLLPSYTQDR